MKLLKKLAISLVCALCAVGICASFAACGESSNETDLDANLSEGTYVFYVYLDDGVTPVEGMQLQFCYNNSATSSTCFMTVAKTDANGRAEVDLSSATIYSDLCVHFYALAGSSVTFPTGYTYPSGGQTINLNSNASYDNAWYVTSQITTFKLTKTETDPDANLSEGIYVFYVYLDDGVTPVEGMQLQFCYNNSATSSTCFMTVAKTDANGRAEVDLSSATIYSDLCVHFYALAGTSVTFPTGYTYPSGGQTINLNSNASYDNAWYVTSQITTFKLTKTA